MKDTKEHILETVFILFLQKSFKAVTMQEIVKQAGISKGAFYHYFASKEQVFEEIVNQYFMRLVDMGFDQFSTDSLQAFYTDLLHVFDSQNKLMKQMKTVQKSGGSFNFYALVFEALKIVPAFKKKFFEIQEQERKAWIKIVKIAQKNNEIRSDLKAEKIAKLFIYANDGVGIRYIIDNDIESMREEITAVYKNLYDLLKT